MTSTVILSDNGASSGSAGLKSTAGNDGTLLLQTTTSGGTATTAMTINNTQAVTFAGNVAVTGTLTGGIAAPQVTVYTSGSGTYTVPAGAKYLTVEMIGGGGGGGGGGTSGTGGHASQAGSTTFGTSLLTCTGGQGLNTSSYGGSATINSPATGIAMSGNVGQLFFAVPTAVGSYCSGGIGGAGPWGGCGSGQPNGGGTNAVANSGAGGGGGGSTAAGNTYGGGGGGAGGYIKAFISSLAASYSYAVGAGSAGGSAGPQGYTGGAGGSGIIVVTAYF